MHANYGFPRGISVFGGLCAALACATFLYTFKKLNTGSRSITFGSKPEKIYTNSGWFNTITIFADGVIALVLFIYEILLIFSPIKFKWYSYILLRVGGYVYTGLTVLGVAGDLGISACILCLIAAAFNFLCALMLWFGCMAIDDKVDPKPEKKDDKDDQKEEEKEDSDKSKDNKKDGEKNEEKDTEEV